MTNHKDLHLRVLRDENGDKLNESIFVDLNTIAVDGARVPAINYDPEVEAIIKEVKTI